ncbi:MAG: DUF59 domain-containing protein, partial [Anaerolineales bacterium]|nr:DUF59 domain-containing protein [Anaerolineales bacterium]
QVEHPEIKATLVDLGMIRDIQIDEETESVSLTLVLPVLGIPQNVRDYMLYSIYEAAKKEGAKEFKPSIAEMTPDERAKFFHKEQDLWRG